jgi:hypothetical protein
MQVYEIDPITDPRWEEFLQTNSQASIFHTRDWLLALQETYGYQPTAFTASPPGRPISSGLPFCRISGWLKGRRLVSLPFSDHCTPLVENSAQLADLLIYIRGKCIHEGWDHLEIRVREGVGADSSGHVASRFVVHSLDLEKPLEEIFSAFHDSCVRRKIRRAEREKLRCVVGNSELLVKAFYSLLIMTRRRHGLPPQPLAWFRNLLKCMGKKATISVAFKEGVPVASMLTLRYKHILVYKYGCSDRRFSSLGGTQLLLWNAIQDAKASGLSDLDMGRSECNNRGLITFKDYWGANRSSLEYLTYPSAASSTMISPQSAFTRYMWAHLPDCFLAAAGRVLYRQMG